MNRLARMQLAESRRTIAQAEGTLRGATRHARALHSLLDSTAVDGDGQGDYLTNELAKVEAFCDELDSTIDDHRSRVARLEQQERIK